MFLSTCGVEHFAAPYHYRWILKWIDAILIPIEEKISKIELLTCIFLAKLETKYISDDDWLNFLSNQYTYLLTYLTLTNLHAYTYYAHTFGMVEWVNDWMELAHLSKSTATHPTHFIGDGHWNNSTTLLFGSHHLINSSLNLK